jgi:uncharacterized membrane protein
MTCERLQAFSDGVIAILITIMVLELEIPEGVGWEALRPLLPGLLSYLLSFVFLGIYWNNHHHFFQMVDRVDGIVLWTNLHLLFWLSLVPVTTAWMSRVGLATVPVAAYGVVLLAAAVAWLIMQASILRHEGPDSKLRAALGSDVKGKLSAGLYVAAIPLALASTWLSIVLYVTVALIWLIPDRRVEAAIRGRSGMG